MQILAASGAAVLFAGLLGSLAALTIENIAAQSALAAREARVDALEGAAAKGRAQLDARAQDLAQRQDFIERVVEAHLGDLPDEASTRAIENETRDQHREISRAEPAAGTLDRVERHQFALVRRLTSYAEARAERTASAIRSLGLSPATMMAAAARAEGGPYFRLATARDGTLDPRFRQLGASLARMSALDASLESIPQVQPAHVPYVSSSFGYRSDPFTGDAAFHAGLDFPGPFGAPIYAAARGRVIYAGIKQGYGNCVEIDHGNGLVTRYAHMSRFVAQVGQSVDAGQSIGEIGSTGRSTGPHLHFEVRVHDRPVNPRKFLDVARGA